MAHRTIEEIFGTIRSGTRRRRPEGATLDAGVVSGDGDLASALSAAGQQIAQLQAAYQQQASVLAANTQAILRNIPARSASSVLGTVGSTASGFLGGTLGFLSPLISGLESLFGGHSARAPIPLYVPPPPVAISATLNSASSRTSQSLLDAGTSSPAVNSGGNPADTAPQVTINVSAMDTQSFLDRSGDVASAVREAMLNLHPINDVIANL